ncbi:chorismate mutase [Phanerochaete sordida]|uniref:chorismate mutase n=1 Tax=Phanerochaete sordida TaxID=48140 RepID=A0A9P3LC37_9APHY|nr:chorismate mutase [Phanerochaete sordida]
MQLLELVCAAITLPSLAVLAHVDRPTLTVPGLVQIRDILAQLEAPIISTLTERINLATDPTLYSNNGKGLLRFLEQHEVISAASGRYDYGKLEYPFTLPPVAPDVSTSRNAFPPSRFHQDSFSGNENITAFYLNTLVPLFTSKSSFYYHLDNSTINHDAVLNLDATLLALLSHRAHIGKIVAETKYASNVTGFTDLIKAQDAAGIRVLVTNTTQESGVLSQASTAAAAFSDAWSKSGALVPGSFASNLQNATAKLFRELIDITTEIEVQYLLQRLR